MRTPRDVYGAEAVRALRRLGFESVRQTGSHHIMKRDAKTVVVPQHKPIKPGTLRGMLDQAGVSLDEFTAAL
ncbi:type II toxin-antitoxin system HicA family toxin [Prosthecobacter sp.]|uniref:type II toxin-antitoxin system HicA family toxin n=1 Tax=Prosthecobacter sp. TaxID=1965333 RepID=UPI002489840B|nr:type II toxin-antitoxin system HicA family toxin [Prosthecobacter sp.]MDI1312164.1 type II toxin-antitoxin system HicA family toxin [Prosthecobacter sp.]